MEGNPNSENKTSGITQKLFTGKNFYFQGEILIL